MVFRVSEGALDIGPGFIRINDRFAGVFSHHIPF